MNLIYDTLLQRLPGVKRRTGGGNWNNFNAVCCTYNGEVRSDTRGRGGLILGSDGACVYHCFNCKYKAAWKEGSLLSKKMENVLEWANVPPEELKKIKFKVWQLNQNARSEKPIDATEFTKNVRLNFKESPLPPGSQPFSYWLQPENFREEFAPVIEYAMDRGMDVFNATTYYWCPDVTEAHYDINKRMIVPFYWEDKLVGFTARDTSGELKYRYYTEAQPNYIFNTGVVDHESEFIFVSEGPFDALAIQGVAMLGDKVTNEQAEWLNNTGKRIVVVPDKEKMGGDLVDKAMRHGWGVAMPKWGDMNVKDSAQAVQELGKIYTMLSITGSIMDNAMQIGVRRQMALKEAKHTKEVREVKKYG